VIALFLAALVAPVVTALQRFGIPRKLAALLVVDRRDRGRRGAAHVRHPAGCFGCRHLSTQVSNGLEEIRNWLKHGPLNASDTQIDSWIVNAQDYVRPRGKDLASTPPRSASR